MKKSNHDLSIADLTSLLGNRKTEWKSLDRKRTKLKRNLERVERQIAVLEGRRGPRRGKGSVGKRPRNDMTLLPHMLLVLKRGPKTLKEIADAVQANGYKSDSNDFPNVVYQKYYNNQKLIKHDEKTGTYDLTAEGEKEAAKLKPVKQKASTKKSPRKATTRRKTDKPIKPHLANLPDESQDEVRVRA